MPQAPAPSAKEDPVSVGRRRVPRRIFDSPIGVLRQGEFTVQRSFQVGEGGMMASVPGTVREGDRIVVSFYLPGSAMIVVRGIIRSVLPPDNGLPQRCGLEFENLGFHHKREIRNFVAAATRSDGHFGI